MKIATEIGSASRFGGYESAVELIGGAGFNAWDFSFFNFARYDYQNRCIKDTDDPFRGVNYLAHARELAAVARRLADMLESA